MEHTTLVDPDEPDKPRCMPLAWSEGVTIPHNIKLYVIAIL